MKKKYPIDQTGSTKELLLVFSFLKLFLHLVLVTLLLSTIACDNAHKMSVFNDVKLFNYSGITREDGKEMEKTTCLEKVFSYANDSTLMEREYYLFNCVFPDKEYLYTYFFNKKRMTLIRVCGSDTLKFDFAKVKYYQDYGISVYRFVEPTGVIFWSEKSGIIVQRNNSMNIYAKLTSVGKGELSNKLVNELVTRIMNDKKFYN